MGYGIHYFKGLAAWAEYRELRFVHKNTEYLVGDRSIIEYEIL
jgi:hypothetical protein